MECSKTIYRVTANGVVMGDYGVNTAQEARDMAAQDAGYESEAEMVQRLDQPSELVAELL